MRAIWKYEITVGEGTVQLDMPKEAKILHVDSPGGVIGRATFWAEVNTLHPMEARHFEVFGTGHGIPEGWTYRGTVVTVPFVWHLYEEAS